MILKTLQRFKSPLGLSYVKLGQGPSLVLIHGVGLRLEAWVNQFEALSQNYTVYAVDMPGHGESNLMKECTDISKYTDVIARWIKTELKSSVVIAGHSMGSMIALNFAIRYPKLCSGVIALNSVYRRSVEAKKAVLARVQQIKADINPENVTAPVARWFDYPVQGNDVIYADLCCQWLSQAPLDGYRQAYEVFCLNDGPDEADLMHLDVPAIFITSRDDPNSLPSMSEEMARICPHGRSYIVENARHMAPLTHSSEINPKMIDFASSCFSQSEEMSYE
ncbi:alpha/beta hydrolase [Marinomonas sp. UCMA 3892]|jgi:(E)-2-((N-methylformamido)methylene)succinate hydrolase|uniref:Alpha/beta hydrolase fold n=1 Tax=Marinomonas sp. (strain MWYL1) TaxID=400668 RepID=A6VY71_MARMS|nr:alpha/beta hydrolase [Marinomonas sp. UCMA 3892]NLU98960.1 alpha/beta hydrolase [Marinomonas sp. UCMA 3892]